MAGSSSRKTSNSIELAKSLDIAIRHTGPDHSNFCITPVSGFRPIVSALLHVRRFPDGKSTTRKGCALGDTNGCPGAVREGLRAQGSLRA